MNNLRCTKSITGAIGIVSLVIGLQSSLAQAQVYERFDGSAVSLSKWQTPEFRGAPQELDFSVSRGFLHNRIRLTGDKADGTEGTSTARSRLRLPAKRVVRADGTSKMSALTSLVIIRSARVRGCGLSDDSAVTKARYVQFSSWFNDGRTTGRDDLTGTVFASIALEHDENSTGKDLNVVAGLAACENVDCSEVRDLLPLDDPNFSAKFGSALIGERVSLRASWHPAKNEIRYIAKAARKPLSQLRFDYSSVTTNGASVPNPEFSHSLQTQATTANCDFSQASVKRPLADIDVDVDSVSAKFSQ